MTGGLTDLNKKSIKIKRIIIHQKPPDISDDLVDAPDHHADGKVPRPPAPPLDDMDHHGQAEEGDHDGVGGDAGTVLEHAPFHGADGQRAVRVWAEGY